MIQHPRKVRNFLVRPQFQLKYMLYFWVSGLSIFGAYLAIIFVKLDELKFNIANSAAVDFELQNKMNATIFDLIIFALVALLLFSVVTFFYSIIITHRVAGPMLAIKAYIDELAKGNYDYNRNLRQYDELHPIMDSVKSLAEQLKKSKK